MPIPHRVRFPSRIHVVGWQQPAEKFHRLPVATGYKHTVKAKAKQPYV